ncbi:hypothetical protein ACHAPV_010081 [Trichoderma viride]
MVRLMKDDIALADRFGWTPLHLATIYEHEKLLRYITQEHAEAMNFGDNGLRTPLQLAVENELIVAVQILIQAGAKVNTPAKDGSTALHVAVKQKQEKILKLLLDYGANKEAMDLEGRTPFYVSVEDGETEIIRLLKDDGAEVTTAAKDGRTPLHVALSRGQDGIKVAKMLLEAGADIDTKALDGATGLHIAAESGSLFETLELWIKNNLMPPHGFNSFHLFRSPGSFENLDSSIGNDPRLLDINATDEYGQTPLLIAIYKADWRSVKLLLDMGASVNADKRNGYTTVLGAVIGENEDILLQLLRKGANVNDADGDGYSALHLAILNGNQRIVQALLASKANIDPVVPGSNDTLLHFAVRKGQAKIIQTLLEQGANTVLFNSLDFSPLQYALFGEDLPMVRILAEHDKNSAIKAALQQNKEGDTPLHTLAACTGNEETICEMLDELLSIDPSIDINAKNWEGCSPLDVALFVQTIERRMFIAELLKRGAGPGSDYTNELLEEWKNEGFEG